MILADHSVARSLQEVMSVHKLPGVCDVTGSAQALRMSSICDMPYDVLFELFGYLSAVEITNVFSTCRALHNHAPDMSIWQRLCARHGLHDLTHFNGLSPFTIYTQLLHPYGPLIGLWASDYPYRGSIIEFRLFAGDKSEHGGIVGELWRFPESFASVDGKPQLPEYIRMLKIGFDLPRDKKLRADKSSTAVSAHVICNALQADQSHSGNIEVLPSSYQGYFLQGYRRTFPHPEFPAPGADWHDNTRGVPRLKPSLPHHIDQRELVRIFPAVRLPIIFAATTQYQKPAAISIQCATYPGTCPCTHNLQPFLPFDDLAPSPPRYYPLKRDIHKSVEPESAEWCLETLTGLWLGSYAQNGTECIHISWHDECKELRACKITGDIHVPRGARSWTFRARSDIECPPSIATMFGITPAPSRVFTGTGTISERGFQHEAHVSLLIGIVSADEIKIWWDQLNGLGSFIRYKGRDDVS
ncbi:hypothetical protein WOLCODRAFT_166671 [Wolfiporia cocos MD-104 SS10]|uniref:F-box domain-containing protein n=1 Tax=Wolfiporia cocos (strain MD-104) TaxID=742152 RepID=A0A2H3JHA6_WOLCO|nr:hypothetical protein WOLCODRAFT_166671 [Wolfiporia cocos MD-104 SS10]